MPRFCVRITLNVVSALFPQLLQYGNTDVCHHQKAKASPSLAVFQWIHLYALPYPVSTIVLHTRLTPSHSTQPKCFFLPHITRKPPVPTCVKGFKYLAIATRSLSRLPSTCCWFFTSTARLYASDTNPCDTNGFRDSSRRTDSKHPERTASYRGESPCSVSVLSSDPAAKSMNSICTAGLPNEAAACSGVYPVTVSGMLTLAWASRRCFTIDVWQPWVASSSAVEPLRPWRASTSTEHWRAWKV